ncbi:7-carboxy-7-deazaguanine synthase QueE [Marinicella rhabdoformis]|uniref:7-carboxy-7-deazaguanine synthase QueE n=1 Tax=Marinicella rhabdoformis TaxID=2580566 RepID=UPI0012AED1AF|nr:7-carboxy-7-deazaguanine synthase QueE [Marinicella rhabdoformis]
MNESRDKQLKIHEIFHSLQGESNSSGWRTVFVRLTGCPLRCTWCDTEYAFHGGHWMDYDTIIEEIKKHGTDYVCITGGEPLSQKRVHGLMDRLVEGGFNVSIETAGALPVRDINPAVTKVVDMKAPGSGEDSKNDYNNLDHLSPKDQVKFVIADDTDYQWSKNLIDKHQLTQKCTVLMSPVADHMPETELADWIIRDQLDVRFQIQLHKLLWGNKPGT